MSIFAFTVGTFTPVPVADATNVTDAGFMALIGGSTTQRVKIKELFMGGQAGVSSPMIMLLARDSIVQVGASALVSPNSAAPIDPSTAALAAPPIAFIAAATTKPQRSNSLTISKLGNFSFNAFGGLIRKEWAPGEEPQLLGNTASLGEISLSAFTGGTPGAIGAHLVYEPL